LVSAKGNCSNQCRSNMVQLASTTIETTIRMQLIEALFRTLDINHNRNLGITELRRFATACGFKGTRDEWGYQFLELLERYGWDRRGPNLEQFAMLVDDKHGSGYCTDNELVAVTHWLRTCDSSKQTSNQQDCGGKTPKTPPRSPITPNTKSPRSLQPQPEAGEEQKNGQRFYPHPGQQRAELQGQRARSVGRSVSPAPQRGGTGSIRSATQPPQRPTASEQLRPKLNPEIERFLNWACAKWHLIRDMFEKIHLLGAFKHDIVQGTTTRRGLTLIQWEKGLRSLGFSGNAKAVFEEILGEPLDDEDDLRRRQDAIGIVAPTHHTQIIQSLMLGHVVKYEARVKALSASLVAAHTSSAVSHLVKVLLERRGCLLRAWRLDLDIRGSGRVAFVDFTQACRRLRGLNAHARNIWSSLRPNDDPRPLEFSELGGNEAENLDAFVEVLWLSMGFNLERSWHFMDKRRQYWLSADDFREGVKKLGFWGNAQLLFQGLDSEGIGRITRSDFEYLRFVAQRTPRHLHDDDLDALADLVKWVQCELGGVDEFLCRLGRLGLMSDGITLADLTAQLSLLGFNGNALQAASCAARYCGGIYITLEYLRRLLSTCLGTTHPSSTLPTSPFGNHADPTSGCPRRPGMRTNVNLEFPHRWPVCDALGPDMASIQIGKSGDRSSPERDKELQVSPHRRFLRFVTQCFGSVHKAFRKLDVKRAGRIYECDFCREVRRAGFPGSPKAVFVWLDKDRVGFITFQDFTKLVELENVLDAGSGLPDLPADQVLCLPARWHAHTR